MPRPNLEELRRVERAQACDFNFRLQVIPASDYDRALEYAPLMENTLRMAMGSDRLSDHWVSKAEAELKSKGEV